MSLRTPLGRVLGLGSAKDGTAHWWTQRLTAVALVPLGLWFMVALAALAGAGYGEFLAWVRQPLNASLMTLFVVVAAYHSELGLQVVVEDYVHAHWLRVSTLVLLKFAHVLLALAGVFALLGMSFGG